MSSKNTLVSLRKHQLSVNSLTLNPREFIDSNFFINILKRSFEQNGVLVTKYNFHLQNNINYLELELFYGCDILREFKKVLRKKRKNRVMIRHSKKIRKREWKTHKIDLTKRFLKIEKISRSRNYKLFKKIRNIPFYKKWKKKRKFKMKLEFLSKKKRKWKLLKRSKKFKRIVYQKKKNALFSKKKIEKFLKKQDEKVKDLRENLENQAITLTKKDKVQSLKKKLNSVARKLKENTINTTSRFILNKKKLKKKINNNNSFIIFKNKIKFSKKFKNFKKQLIYYKKNMRFLIPFYYMQKNKIKLKRWLKYTNKETKKKVLRRLSFIEDRDWRHTMHIRNDYKGELNSYDKKVDRFERKRKQYLKEKERQQYSGYKENNIKIFKNLLRNKILFLKTTLLNKKINFHWIKLLNKKLKWLKKRLFSKTIFWYYDLLKLSGLFIQKKIVVSTYLKILSIIFTKLHKRLYKVFINLLKILFKFFLYSKKTTISGLKFLMHGRITGKLRAKSFRLSRGSLGSASTWTNSHFAQININNRGCGCFGLAMWVGYNQLKTIKKNGKKPNHILKAYNFLINNEIHQNLIFKKNRKEILKIHKYKLKNVYSKKI